MDILGHCFIKCPIEIYHNFMSDMMKKRNITDNNLTIVEAHGRKELAGVKESSGLRLGGQAGSRACVRLCCSVYILLINTGSWGQEITIVL